MRCAPTLLFCSAVRLRHDTSVMAKGHHSRALKAEAKVHPHVGVGGKKSPKKQNSKHHRQGSSLDSFGWYEPEARATSDNDISMHVGEVERRTKGKDYNVDRQPTFSQRVVYYVENYVSSDGNAMLKVLIVFTVGAISVMGILWALVINIGGKSLDDFGGRRLLGDASDDDDDGGGTLLEDMWRKLKSKKAKAASGSDEDDDGGGDFQGFYLLGGAHRLIWYCFQIVAIGGYDDNIGEGFSGAFGQWFGYLECMLLTIMIVFGLVVFAILVGIITDNVTSLMESIEDGTMEVIEEGHTLILGWNQASVRFVCQISFLRRQFQMQNATLARRLFPWLRVSPSSPVARGKIVILANEPGINKVDIQDILTTSLAERGVDASSTRVGWDVVIRIGDPSSVSDLMRVNASKATAIVTMMTNEDRREAVGNASCVQNGATIRTLLALRSVLCSSNDAINSFDAREVRIVVQLQSDSRCVTAACFRTPKGKKITTTIEVTRFVNTLLFLCAAKRGLSQVVLSAFNFAESSFRARKVTSLCAGPEAEEGYFVGMAFSDACAERCWQDSVLVGITNESVLYGPRAGEKLEGPNGEVLGIVPQPDYVIQASDIAIFIGNRSQPVCSDNPGATREHLKGDLAAAMGLAQSHLISPLNVAPLNTLVLNEQLRQRQTILVCGWRHFWTADNLRLCNRINDVAKFAAPGSRLCFMNQMPTDGHPTGDDFASRVKPFAVPLDGAADGPAAPRLVAAVVP